MIQEVAGGRILKGSVEYTGEDHKKENNVVTLRIARAETNTTDCILPTGHQSF